MSAISLIKAANKGDLEFAKAAGSYFDKNDDIGEDAKVRAAITILRYLGQTHLERDETTDMLIKHIHESIDNRESLDKIENALIFSQPKLHPWLLKLLERQYDYDFEGIDQQNDKYLDLKEAVQNGETAFVKAAYEYYDYNPYKGYGFLTEKQIISVYKTGAAITILRLMSKITPQYTPDMGELLDHIMKDLSDIEEETGDEEMVSQVEDVLPLIQPRMWMADKLRKDHGFNNRINNELIIRADGEAQKTNASGAKTRTNVPKKKKKKTPARNTGTKTSVAKPETNVPKMKSPDRVTEMGVNPLGAKKKGTKRTGTKRTGTKRTGTKNKTPTRKTTSVKCKNRSRKSNITPNYEPKTCRNKVVEANGKYYKVASRTQYYWKEVSE